MGSKGAVPHQPSELLLRRRLGYKNLRFYVHNYSLIIGTYFLAISKNINIDIQYPLNGPLGFIGANSGLL